jgi:ribosome-associated protein
VRPQQSEQQPLDPEQDRILRRIHEGASKAIAREPVALDVRGLSNITDVLYVCHGESERAVEAIVDGVMRQLADAGAKKPAVEGRGALQWVLIDLGDIMVHVFLKERRDYYELERLWHDAASIELPA